MERPLRELRPIGPLFQFNSFEEMRNSIIKSLRERPGERIRGNKVK